MLLPSPFVPVWRLPGHKPLCVLKVCIMMDLRFFTGRANPQLARGICQYLDIELGCIDVSDFSDGEIFVQIRENVRGKDVFLLQPTCHPVNQHLMELLIMTDACRRASAARITAVMP